MSTKLPENISGKGGWGKYFLRWGAGIGCPKKLELTITIRVFSGLQ